MKFKFTPQLLLISLALLSSQFLQAQVIRPFSIYYQNNQKGGIVYISNVSVSCGSDVNCPAAEAELPPTGNGRNNDFTQAYVDVDNDGTTFMSSSDSLNLPACSNVLYAGLFWGGSVNNATPNFANRNRVKLKTNGGSYIDIEADSLVSNNSGSITYHCYKNITAIAQAAGKFARYTVADLVTQTGSSNRFGGWTVVVAYRNDLETLKNLTVFGGVANVSTTSTPVQIDISGFLTPPTGPVTLEMGVVGYDGDRGFVQDSLYFNGAGNFVSVNDALNPTRDIFNSTISNKGVLNPFRQPLLNNTMGLDADIFAPNNTSKNFIGNNATSAALRLTTGNENYFAQVVTTAIDVFEPDIRIGNTTIDINGAPLNPGDTLEYTVTIQNLGSDVSINTQLIDTIPFNLDFVPGSIRVVAGPNQGQKTDAAGDDQAEYDSIGNRVVVRVGNGANAITGGEVVDNPTGADSSTFKFRATVTQECVKLRCSGFVNSIAAGIGTGQLSGNTQANFSNPSILDGQGCPIPGFTSTLINLPPSCSLPPDTAFSACPPFLFASLTNALPGYVYFNGAFNPIAIATSSATYFGIKTLTSGCTDTIALNITIFPSPAFTSVTKTNPSCGLPTSGSFVLNGINPNDSIAFTVGNAHSSASPYVLVSSLTPANTFQNLSSGNYTIRLKNATNCTLDQLITLLPAANCAPVAGDDNFTTNEDTPLNGNVAGNDSDLNLDPLTFTVVSNPIHGSILMNANGTFTYTPNLNYNGQDTLTYKVCDNGAPSLCDTATVVITILPVNDAPIAVDDGENMNEDAILNSTVATNDTDIEGNSLTFSLLSNATNGAVLMNSDGTYSYVPNVNFNGADSFTYLVCDNGVPALCDTGLVSIAVAPVNDAPLAVDDLFFGGINLPINENVSLNDVDVDNDPLVFTMIQAPDSGAIVFNPNGTFTYTPNLNFIGNDTLFYQVCDNGIPALCDTARVILGVNTVNLAPVAVNDSAIVTDEDQAVNGDVSANDFDPNNDPLTYALLSNASNGNVLVNANGTFTYTPALNFNGTDSFTYTVCDTATPVLCSTASVFITVNPVNDAPTAIDDAVFGGLNLPVSGNASTNDFDVDGDPLTYTLIQNPDSGIVGFNPDGTFTYTPNNNFQGNDTLVYMVCDTASPSLCDTAIVVVGVNTINLAPVAVNDVATVDEDNVLNADVSLNDFDPNADTLIYSVFSNPANGIVILNTNGTYTYTPALNFNGIDSFSYTVCDTATPTLCANATVTITVNPINDAPVALNDTATATTVGQVNGNVSLNDVDVDGDTLNYTILINANLGTLVMNANGTFTYVSNGTVGIDTITYVVCDNAAPALCDTALLVITINQAITPPTAVDDNFTVSEDNNLNADVSLNDLSNGSTVAYSILSNVTNGAVILNSNGTFLYVPNANYNGPDSFSYLVCDNDLPPNCDTAVVSINVTPVNDAPVAIDDLFLTNQNVAGNGDVSQNDFDVDGDTLSFSILLNPINGTVSFNSDGTFLYTPNAGYVGLDSLTYLVCDNANPALCDTGLVRITVIGVVVLNQPPLAGDDNFVINEDTQLGADVSLNDSDPNNDPLTYSVLANVTNGTLTLAANGTFTYTPFSNFNGFDSFSYLVCDNGIPSLCDTGFVAILVNPVNDAPDAVEDIFTTAFNTTLNADVSPNDVDIDPDVLTYSLITAPPNGSVTLNSNGTFSYTPNTGFVGTDSFVYRVCDIGIPQLCDSAIVTINVLPDATAAALGLAKSVSNPVPQANGAFAVNYSITIRNYGSATANQIQVSDDLAATFPAPVSFTVTGLSGGSLFTNPFYNGTSITNLLEPLTNSLAPGASDTIRISLLVTPLGNIGPFNNLAIATAINSPADTSVNGINPDPDFNGIPNETGFTPLSFPGKLQIGLSKIATVSDKKSDGTFDVTYTFEVENMGTFPLTGVFVRDNLENTFPSPVTFTVTSLTATGGLSVNNGYTGKGTAVNLLNSQSSTIAPGLIHNIVLKINVNTQGTSGTYLNSAESVANGPNGATTKDVSNNGRVDNNLNGNPSDQGEDTPTPVTLDGTIEVNPQVLIVPQGFTPDGDAQNEFLVIPGILNYPENELTIFNRWGNIVYQRNGYDNTWNGISDKGDGKVTQGTYYYVLKLNKDEVEPRKGYIVIEY